MPDKAQDDDLVMSLVEMALARPKEEREAYLESACTGDSQLFSQVRKYVLWEERMNGFLLDPLCSPLPEPHFDPGELLDDRFRIMRKVGEGGMGIVYEAFDGKLERRIAIKCAKTGFRKRLPPEVRNAREISHPNVCKIFEIHTTSTSQGDIDFITMEFLQGETLTERLRRGPLPENEARAIARQLCAGLAEAHRNQVIHGDLKSTNVILTTGADGASRGVITDFGLARRPEVSQQSVQSAEQGGTPDYMAPELWRGEKASVASDIYALGVILYELASGRRPHGSEATTGSATSWEERLTRKPPAVHPKWDRILGRCLDPDPTRRFQNADEVAQAFGPPRSRRWFLAGAAAALLSITSGVVTYQKATAPQESVRLAVLPFASDQDTGPLAENLLRGASSQLSRLKSSTRTKLTFIPPSEVLRNKMDTPEKARAVLGATHVLHGTLGKENEKVILRAYLTDTRSMVNSKEWKAEYAPGEMRYAPVALAGVVTGAFRLPAVAATVSASARQDYLTGLSYLRRNSGIDAALPLMERAVAADPDSPLMHAGLAEAQWWKYSITKDQSWLDQAAESVRQAERRNPDLAEVHRVGGLLKKEAGRYEQAAVDYRRAIELAPNNGDAYRRLGMACEANNQLEDALVAYRRAIEVEPGHYRNHQALGAFYDQQANYGEASKHYRKAVELAPEEPNTHFVLGAAYMYLGLYSEAENELRFSLRLGETPTASHTLGVILIRQGRDHEAIPHILQALSRGAERYLWWMNLGVAYRRVGLTAESERANRRGLDLAEAEMRKNPRSGYVRSCLAYLCARLGDRPRAESEIAQAVQLSPNEADTRWMAAKTYEALGRREDTLAVLRASRHEVLADLSRYPDLADLHKDPRFIEMLASQQVK